MTLHFMEVVEDIKLSPHKDAVIILNSVSDSSVTVCSNCCLSLLSNIHSLSAPDVLTSLSLISVLADDGSSFFQFGASLQQEALLMLAIMEEYDWHVFSVVTTKFPGFQEFIATVRVTVDHSFVRWDLQSVVTLEGVGEPEDRAHVQLKRIQSPVILLYCAKDEAAMVLDEARSLGLTGAGFVWIVPSLTTGNLEHTPEAFPTGMISVTYDEWDYPLEKRVQDAVGIISSAAAAMFREEGRIPDGTASCNSQSEKPEVPPSALRR
ncbi:hypothetical protein DNTS_017120 [Danionella cerebrum]|uniref:Receptor ligand binding region domain-containing protein n=1 Tax=Danionella cerebrum TaxID=2873325 RepID=A0A553NG52_9TELE|nr:hypothetical protein DNTS_017120 [Danionella translucida]